MAEEQTTHRQSHQDDADDEERSHLEHAQEERASQAADGTEDEVQRGSKRGLVQGHSKTFHENLGRGCVGSHIDTHMAHDAQEREQHDGRAQQFEALHKGRRLALDLLFMDGGYS